jgi:hypothetical protein
MLLVQRRMLTGQCQNWLNLVGWQNTEDIDVVCRSCQSVLHCYDKATEAVKLDFGGHF